LKEYKEIKTIEGNSPIDVSVNDAIKAGFELISIEVMKSRRQNQITYIAILGKK
jgi:hypothetical protein